MIKGAEKRRRAKGGGSVIYLKGSDPVPDKPSGKKSGRRKNPYGEGTIYQCHSGRFKDKWMGQVIIGTNPETGKPIRRTFYGDSWTEVRDKMKLVKAEVDKGIDLQKQAAQNLNSLLTRKKASLKRD